MSCIALTSGRKLKCKGGNSGLKAVSFLAWTSGNAFTATAGEVTTWPVGVTAGVYRYELKNTGNNYAEAVAADAESRTIVYTGTLTAVLQKMDLATRNEIKLLAMGEVIIFAENYNGDVFCIGSGNGAELTGLATTTGGSRTDFSGNTLTFTSIESEPYFYLSTAAKATYVGLYTEGV